MKSWKDPASPWGMRLHFEDQEFEVMMDDLRMRSGSQVFSEGGGINVDRVLLKALEIEPDFTELDPGVMGRVRFDTDGAAEMQVSIQLADEAENDRLARRRLRTTLGHETGHVACHASLFIGDTLTPSLFDPDGIGSRPPAIMCRAESVGRMKYSGEWWEFQANKCMASLLLPRKLFHTYAMQVLQSAGVLDFEKAIKAGQAENVVRELADIFDVSHEAVFYRLQDLGHVPKQGQFHMSFD